MTAQERLAEIIEKKIGIEDERDLIRYQIWKQGIKELVALILSDPQFIEAVIAEYAVVNEEKVKKILIDMSNRWANTQGDFDLDKEQAHAIALSGVVRRKE